MNDLQQTILITGATSGFGKETAKIFIKNGWKVIITGRRGNRLEDLTKELGENCLPLCFDITDRVAVKKEIENIPPDFSNIDVLCNNAGLALGLEGADEANLDDWDKMVDTNIKGLIYATRQVLPKMVQNKSGHIINIGSVAGSYPYPGGNVYGGTKAFVSQFSLNLRADLVSKGINVTSIEPGLAETEFSLVRFKGDNEKANKVYENTNFIKPEDIGETIYWVATRPKNINVNRIEIMALVLNDRVKETTTTTGTGAFALGGAVQGFETFGAGIGNSNTTYYAIFNPGTAEFEVGLGTVNADVTYVVTVVNPGSGNKYYLDGSLQNPINLAEGVKYIFQQNQIHTSQKKDIDWLKNWLNA